MLFIFGCVGSSNTSLYPLKKGEKEKGLSILGGLNVISYTSRYGITDNIEIDGRIGLVTLGGNIKIHLLKTITDIVSFHIGMPNIGNFESGLSYTILSSVIGVRFNIKYQFVFGPNNCYEDSNNDYYDDNTDYCTKIDNFQRFGGSLTIGNNKFWADLGYLSVFDKSLSTHIDYKEDDDIKLFDEKPTNKEYQFILNFGLSF